MTVHENLDNFKQWVEIDVKEQSTRKIILDMITVDSLLDSPTIMKNINGRYSPYRKHISKLGNTQLNVLESHNSFAKKAIML